MSALTRLLLVPAALFLWNGAATAKDSPGLPKALIGSFAKDAKTCMDYYKIKAGKAKWPDKMPNFYEFSEVDGQYFYSGCDSAECKSRVVSYYINKSGYVVNTEDLSPELLATPRGKNKFELSFPPKGAAINVVRCPENPYKNEPPR